MALDDVADTERVTHRRCRVMSLVDARQPDCRCGLRALPRRSAGSTRSPRP